MSSTYLPSLSLNAELWKPEFSIIELNKQLIVTNFAKDNDTILALAQAIMLSKDVSDLAEENSEEIRDLLVIQQVQVSVLTSVIFQSMLLTFLVLSIFYLYCVESPESYHHLRVNKRVIYQDQEVQKEDKLYEETSQARLQGY